MSGSMNIDSKHDFTSTVFRALECCKSNKISTLVFPKGEYHFWPDKAYEKLYFISNHDDDALKRTAFPLIDIENFIIDGGGSEFIFHGLITPFVIENCKNVTLKNFSIDWERPMHSQAIICEVNDDGILAEISDEYPYVVENNHIYFKGEGWKLEPWGVMEFDKNTLAPVYLSGDNFLMDKNEFKISQMEEHGKVYIQSKFNTKPHCGNNLIFRHGKRDNSGIFIKDSFNVFLNSINVHHAGGMGLIAQRSKDITLEKFNVMLKSKTSRAFTTCADATHFVNCKGTIKIENCLFENQMDDAINVHGIYTRIEEKVNDKTLLIQMMHHQHKGVEIAAKGDRMCFVNYKNLLTYGACTVEKIKRLNKDYYFITFKEDLSDNVTRYDVLENITWTPDLIVRNCTAKSNRARGFLITTPGKVIIENNNMSIPGSAIKISGDANDWFESGAVGNILIKNNRFNDCNYCPGAWGRAVIDIDPQIKSFDSMSECYHRNIYIENNTFNTFDIGIVYGYSVDGISFKDNIIKSTKTYPMHNCMDYVIELDECKNIQISSNRCALKHKVAFINNKLVDITETQS